MSRTLCLFDPAVKNAADWKTLTEMVVALLQTGGLSPEGIWLQA